MIEPWYGPELPRPRLHVWAWKHRFGLHHGTLQCIRCGESVHVEDNTDRTIDDALRRECSGQMGVVDVLMEECKREEEK